MSGPPATDTDGARIAEQAKTAASPRDPLIWLAERVAAGPRSTPQPCAAVKTVIHLASNDYLPGPTAG